MIRRDTISSAGALTAVAIRKAEPAGSFEDPTGFAGAAVATAVINAAVAVMPSNARRTILIIIINTLKVK
jgi:hypothetical protein